MNTDQPQVNIFHGWGNSSQAHWFPWIKQQLEARRHAVWMPDLPDADWPDLAKWLPFIQQNGRYDQNTVLVGHSAGCPLILSLLENYEIHVKQVILVAAFIKPLGDDPTNEPPILQKTYDWKKIKAGADEFVFINSDNDPFACDDTVGRTLLDELGGVQIIAKGEGHFGSSDPKQDYPTFPLLLKQISNTPL
jgi:predicted alpha/beta hydrolase family esterase